MTKHLTTRIAVAALTLAIGSTILGAAAIGPRVLANVTEANCGIPANLVGRYVQPLNRVNAVGGAIRPEDQGVIQHANCEDGTLKLQIIFTTANGLYIGALLSPDQVKVVS